jgi:hypothetical protein
LHPPFSYYSQSNQRYKEYTLRTKKGNIIMDYSLEKVKESYFNPPHPPHSGQSPEE